MEGGATNWYSFCGVLVLGWFTVSCVAFCVLVLCVGIGRRMGFLVWLCRLGFLGCVVSSVVVLGVV